MAAILTPYTENSCFIYHSLCNVQKLANLSPISTGKRALLSYFLFMDKKISLDLANQHYYVQIPSSPHGAIFSSVFAIDYLLSLLKKQNGIELYGYCFFPNKIHLLLHSEFLPSIWLEPCLVEYNQWHQETSGESGYVFDDENSQVVLIQPKHLSKALHYVHNLPVINKICSTCDQYLYSSYYDYVGQQKTGVNIDPIMSLLSPHSGQRNRRFLDYMITPLPVSGQKLEQGNHDYYLAYADSTYLTRILSQYQSSPFSGNIEQHFANLWQQCLNTLMDITQLEENTLLGISRQHSLPDAHFVLAWLFVDIAAGPVYYASKYLTIDEATLQLKVKSIPLHHPKLFLSRIAAAWHKESEPA